MKLYEMTEQLRNILEQGEIIGDEVMDSEGELFDAEALEQLDIARNEKIEGIAVFIKELIADVEALSEEKKKLDARIKAKKNKADWLKGYLMAQLGGAKFESPKAVISYRKSTQLVIAADAEVPEMYLKYKAPDIDKAGLKSAIVKDGLTFPGITVEECQNIQIK